jgi:hypothetical protein
MKMTRNAIYRVASLCLASLCLASLASLQGQTKVDLSRQAKGIDFTGASTTKPMKAGAALPATCGAGELFFNTTAPSGANLYACTATNTWTVQGGQSSSFSSGAGAPMGGCSAGQTYFDTTNGNTWFCETPGLWQRALTTNNVGAFVITGQDGSSPGAAPAGNTSLFFNSSAKIAQSVDDAGSSGTMVRPTDCSASGQLVQKVNGDGTLTCGIAGGPVTYNFPAGGGSTASPQTGAWWQDGTTTAVCPAGSPFQCSLHWNSGASILAITTSVPHLWSSGTVSASLKFQGNGTGNTVQPAVSSGCVSNGGAFSFNAAQTFPSQATSGSNYYLTTVSSLTMTGCAADSMMVLQFSRADIGGFLNLAEASVTFNIP